MMKKDKNHTKKKILHHNYVTDLSDYKKIGVVL